jgi:hypothetical protein
MEAWEGVLRRSPWPYTDCPQVVEKMSLPFFAMSLSLSPRSHLIAVGFAGECWQTQTQAVSHGGQAGSPAAHLCLSSLSGVETPALEKG